MSRPSTRKKSTPSKCWKYYYSINEEQRTAKCKICHSELSYRSSVTNLMKHIQRLHKYAFSLRAESSEKSEKSDNSDVGDVPAQSETTDDEINKNESEDDHAAKSLREADGSLLSKEEEGSICLLCQKSFPDRNPEAMMDHMLNVHNVSQIKLVNGNLHIEQDVEQEVEELRMTRKKPKRYSVAWRYFTIRDERLRTAVCKFCRKAVSYNTTVTNLMRHVRRYHRAQMRRDGDEGERGQTGSKPRSGVWAFFDYVDKDREECACVHCDTRFQVRRGQEPMRKHLVDEHPEILLHHKSGVDPLFDTKTDKEDENDQNDYDEEHLEEEHLDDDYFSETPQPLKSRLSHDPPCARTLGSHTQQHAHKPLASPHTDRPRGKPPGTLDHFANYITSLLQELPYRVSKRLQMEFVRQIIEAQMSCADNEDRTVNSSGGDVTVGNSDSAVAVSSDSGVAVSSDSGVAVSSDSSVAVNGDRAGVNEGVRINMATRIAEIDFIHVNKS